MNFGTLLAVIMVPIVCGLAATFIVSRVQAGLARKRDSTDTRTGDDSDL